MGWTDPEPVVLFWSSGWITTHFLGDFIMSKSFARGVHMFSACYCCVAFSTCIRQSSAKRLPGSLEEVSGITAPSLMAKESM